MQRRVPLPCALLPLLLLAAGCGADRRGRGGGGGGGGLPGDAGPEQDTGEPAEDGPRAVCERWEADWQDVEPEWLPDPDDDDRCALGTVPDEAQDNAIRRTNLYRFLVGLEPVEFEPVLQQQQQECAVVMAAMGDIDHHPRSSAPCWTTLAATSAGSSNLALGYGMADSVDGYVDDGGVPSLGHRRWVLNPRARVTAFGYRPPTGCMYSFSDDRPLGVDLVAWPPPGYVPIAAAEGRWHFSDYAGALRGAVSVSISVDDGELQPVEAEALEGGVAGSAGAWAFDVRYGRRHDRTVRVVAEGERRGELDYTVHFVDCGRVLAQE